MKGFTKSMLLILPSFNVLDKKSRDYMLNVDRSIDNLIKLFKEINITIKAITTNETSLLLLKDKDIKWVECIPYEDIFFYKNNCILDMTYPDKSNIIIEDDLEKIKSFVRDKVKIKKGLSTEERLAKIIKRQKEICKLYVSKQKAIFNMSLSKSCDISVTIKNNIQQIIFIVNPINFLVDCYIGGNKIDIAQVLCDDSTLNRLYDWRCIG